MHKASPLPLTLYPDEVLKTPGSKISPREREEMRELALRMTETMYHEHGVGLAAQQIGKALRICVIDVDGTLHTLINPKITSFSKDMHTDEEGCLSIPKKFFPLTRHWKVTVRYEDLDGNTKKLRASGLLARAVQHELDHLQGIVVLDRYHEQKGNR